MNGGYIELVIGIKNQLITGGAPPCMYDTQPCIDIHNIDISIDTGQIVDICILYITYMCMK